MTDPRTAAALPAEVQELRVPPEVLAALDRIAAAFESVAAAIVPDDDAVDAELLCGAPIWRPGDTGDGLPLVCTRLRGHHPGCVAHDEDGNVLACTLGRPPAAPEGWRCPACGERVQAGS